MENKYKKTAKKWYISIITPICFGGVLYLISFFPKRFMDKYQWYIVLPICLLLLIWLHHFIAFVSTKEFGEYEEYLERKFHENRKKYDFIWKIVFIVWGILDILLAVLWGVFFGSNPNQGRLAKDTLMLITVLITVYPIALFLRIYLCKKRGTRN